MRRNEKSTWVASLLIAALSALMPLLAKGAESHGSRAQGVFAGVSLSGTSLGPDGGVNEKVYGKKVSGEQIWSGAVKAPASAQELLAVLDQKSPKNESTGK